MSGSPSMCQLTLEWRKRNSNTIFVYFPPPRFIHWSSPRVLTFVHSISDQMLGQFLSRFFYFAWLCICLDSLPQCLFLSPPVSGMSVFLPLSFNLSPFLFLPPLSIFVSVSPSPSLFQSIYTRPSVCHSPLYVKYTCALLVSLPILPLCLPGSSLMWLFL